jgi:hypothetical protein
MKIAIMQPYFLPYIGYWQLIHSVDRFIIYDDVNYIKGGWINRNRILINGNPTFITLPLNKTSSYKRICDITIQPRSIWCDKLLKMIELTYRKSPFFFEIFPIIEKVISYKAESLSDYLTFQIKTLALFMGIKTELVLASRLYENSCLSGQDRIIDLCKIEGANMYVNPQGGQILYNSDIFNRSGIDLKFIVMHSLPYKQPGEVFFPSLSIIDVLMANGPIEIKYYLSAFDLVNSKTPILDNLNGNK